MSDGDTLNAGGPSAPGSVVPLHRDKNTSQAIHSASTAVVSAPSVPQQVSFDRRELSEILNLYGRRVAEGEWRDYAIDMLKDRAVFSIFRRTSEVPLYRIEKIPRLARRQGAFALHAATGQVLKRGHELSGVLRVLDKPVRLVTGA